MLADTVLAAQLEREDHPGRRLDLIDHALRPPEPQLLDTCVLQNLDWVDREIARNDGQVSWDEEAEAGLIRRYGVELANDLLDLGTLYKRFEYDGGYPWLVCSAAMDEAGRSRGLKGVGLRDIANFFMGHQEDWGTSSYPGIAQGLLTSQGRVSPLILRGLGVSTPQAVFSADGPLYFLPDLGDRLIAAHALFANVPVVLTTDRKTFWNHRAELLGFGLQVMRPKELLDLYEPYWEALAGEVRRRQGRR